MKKIKLGKRLGKRLNFNVHSMGLVKLINFVVTDKIQRKIGNRMPSVWEDVGEHVWASCIIEKKP